MPTFWEINYEYEGVFYDTYVQWSGGGLGPYPCTWNKVTGYGYAQLYYSPADGQWHLNVESIDGKFAGSGVLDDAHFQCCDANTFLSTDQPASILATPSYGPPP